MGSLTSKIADLEKWGELNRASSPTPVNHAEQCMVLAQICGDMAKVIERAMRDIESPDYYGSVSVDTLHKMKETIDRFKNYSQ